MFSMANVLSTAKRVQIVSALVEGNSLRATARMANVSRNTVNKLLLDLGTACATFQDSAVRDVASKRIQCDEIWSFVYAKEKNVPAEMQGEIGVGDVWTYTAIDADSKLCLSWLVGPRDAGSAHEFMQDVANRVNGRVQLTTDGHRMYLTAVESAFGRDVDFAQLVKHYGTTPEGPEVRYSPAHCTGISVNSVMGRPDADHVSTSYVERSNLTIRMSIRRFTRLTNAFSKKLEQHTAAIALHFMHYNFCRPHLSLRTERNNRITPAMASGLAKAPWTLEEVVGLLQ
jgi:IS1 family transposase